MGFCITNDFLHKYVLKAILPVALHNRYIVEGASTEERIVCISFDCDLDADIERVPLLLDLLKKEQIRSTFAVVGGLVTKYPVVIKEILDKGHEIMNHTFSHPDNFGSIDSKQMGKEIGSFQNLLVSECGYRPRGFRAPHLMRKYDVDLFCVLKEEELYDSSYVGRGIKRIDGTVEVALTSCPEHPQVCFDYWHHFQLPMLKSSYTMFLTLWRLLLDREQLINVYFDPNIVSEVFFEDVISQVSDAFTFLKLEEIVENMCSNDLSTSVTSL